MVATNRNAPITPRGQFLVRWCLPIAGPLFEIQANGPLLQHAGGPAGNIFRPGDILSLFFGNDKYSVVNIAPTITLNLFLFIG